MEMKNPDTKLGCRVVLFPQPFLGHLTPMLHLGYALCSKGFSVTIIQTRFNAPDPAQFPNFTFHYIEDALSKSESPPSDTWQILQSLNTSCVDPLRVALARLLEDASKSKEPIGCLITEPMWEFAGTVADEFNLPKMALRPGGLLALLVYDSLPLLREKGYFLIPDTGLEEPVLEIPPLKVKDLPSQQHELLEKLGTETKSYSQGIICNTFKELEGSTLDRVREKLHNTPIFPIGPLHKYSPSYSTFEPDPSCMSWLNSQAPNSVLYVSFGTLAAISKELFVEIAWGLVKSKQPFLWVVRKKMVNGSENAFPSEFLEVVAAGKGHVVTWAPQEQVLAHVAIGGFWTHCGWNSTMESICEGVPMICLPLFADQTINVRVITDILGVGLQLEKGPRRDEIEMAIRTLMVEEKGRQMRQSAAVLKEKAKICLREGGSSHESLNKLTAHILSFANAKRTTS
uniref:Uncharacterized protein n=1 Tax=Opuntia streptacantha TaxID=393608 RepID=A0A7C8YCU5_OPUST